MADNIRLTVDLAGFGVFSAAAERALAAAVEAVAEAVVNEAKDRAPVSATGSNGNPPGFLRDSITYELESPLVAEVLAEADYALYVEEGHHTSTGSFVPAQPFFTPAVEAERRRFPERVAEALAEVTRG